MTTDTFAKAATASASFNGRTVSINGIAKGSGMIAPDMATLLVFLFTDAALPARHPAAAARAQRGQKLQLHHRGQRYVHFRHGPVRSHRRHRTGTGGAAGPRTTRASNGFAAALDRVTLELAHLVVRDGEGAEKFIAIEVSGAATDRAARRIGFAIANSPLVKTAIAGEDVNWGRIVMAIGKSGAKADRDRLKIWMGGVRVARNGQRDPAYVERDVVPHMKGRNIDIKVDVGVGRGKATVWTCDLTHRYVEINGSYRS